MPLSQPWLLRGSREMPSGSAKPPGSTEPPPCSFQHPPYAPAHLCFILGAQHLWRLPPEPHHIPDHSQEGGRGQVAALRKDCVHAVAAPLQLAAVHCGVGQQAEEGLGCGAGRSRPAAILARWHGEHARSSWGQHGAPPLGTGGLGLGQRAAPQMQRPGCSTPAAPGLQHSSTPHPTARRTCRWAASPPPAPQTAPPGAGTWSGCTPAHDGLRALLSSTTAGAGRSMSVEQQGRERWPAERRDTPGSRGRLGSQRMCRSACGRRSCPRSHTV